MRIAVMGAGGVGGYFGARLAQAGQDVAFVARGPHLAALRERGLFIRSALGDVHLPKPTATDDPATLGWFDAVLFAVKLWDTETAAAAIKPLLAAGGVVIPFQNGVESIERVGAVIGAQQVMGGVAYIAAKIAEPGTIVHTGTMARLRFGPVIPGQQTAADALLAACKDAGVDAEIVADIRKALWMKFVFLVALSGLTSVTRQPIGVIRADPDSAGDARGGNARGMVGGPRARDRPGRRFHRRADALRRRAARRDEGVDAARSRCGQSARGAVALRRRRADGEGIGNRGTGQCDALRCAEAVLRRRLAVIDNHEA